MKYWVVCLNLFVTLVVGAGESRAACESEAQQLPRYKFKVGQQLSYAGQAVFKYQRNVDGATKVGAFISDDFWEFTVLRQNQDESWRILITYRRTETRRGTSGSEAKGDEEVFTALADIDSAGGLFERFDSFGDHVDPRSVLVKLPTDEVEYAEGWKCVTPSGNGSIRYSARSPEMGKVALAAELRRIEYPVYGMKAHETIEFDLERGMPLKIMHSTTQTYGFNGTGRRELLLTSEKLVDADRCAVLSADAELGGIEGGAGSGCVWRSGNSRLRWREHFFQGERR